jgi:L-arabinose transport system ATP-binding protein
VSSDLAEVMGICDRILVMRNGRLAGDLPRAEATAERLVRLALPN